MSKASDKEEAKLKTSEYNRAYYAANRQALLEKRRAKRAASPGYWRRWNRTKRPHSETQKAKQSERNKAYYAANRDSLKAKARSWRAANIERDRARNREYKKTHGPRLMQEMLCDPVRKERYYRRQVEWQKQKAATNPSFAIYQRILVQMNRAMQKHLAGRNVTSRSKIVQLLGCEWSEFVRHIEAQFQPGMTWQNHGRSGWHFDHIRPLSSFDLTDDKQLAEGCHFTNVQPLWAADNIRKAGKIA